WAALVFHGYTLIVANFKSEDLKIGHDGQCSRILPARRSPSWNDRKASSLCVATPVVPSKVNAAGGHFFICSSSYDLIRAFVVAAFKHLVTVVTVENQHVNHPPCPSSSRPNL